MCIRDRAKIAAEYELYSAIRSDRFTSADVESVETMVKPSLVDMSLEQIAADVRDSIAATLVGLVGGDIVTYEYFNAISQKMPNVKRVIHKTIIKQEVNETNPILNISPPKVIGNVDMPPKPFSKHRPKHAFIDLLGTVIHHRTERELALMGSFLRGLASQHGWNITILTSFGHKHACQLVEHLDLPESVQIVSSAGTTKGLVINASIHNIGDADYLYLDDKPKNLASVRDACGKKVRVIGFVGSHKYTPAISEWCAHNEVELALSVSDLCEGLHVDCDAYGELVDSGNKWTEDEISMLIPGLDHPLSPLAGETCYLDHRAAMHELLDNREIADYPRIWQQMAWITCGECLVKVCVRSVIKSIGIDHQKVLGSAYKYQEYLSALRRFAEAHREIDFRRVFNRAFSCAQDGIRSLGIEAERCRISDRPIDFHRLDFARERVTQCLEW